jgi:hypothetical protein
MTITSLMLSVRIPCLLDTRGFDLDRSSDEKRLTRFYWQDKNPKVPVDCSQVTISHCRKPSPGSRQDTN